MRDQKQKKPPKNKNNNRGGERAEQLDALSDFI